MFATDFKGYHERPCGLLPSDLDGIEPGLVLGAFLSSVDIDDLSGHDRVVVLRAHQRMASHYAAKVYEDMVSIVDAYGDLGHDTRSAADGAAAEIRTALTLTRRAADAELGFALELEERLPRVAQALSTGSIDQRRARTLVDTTLHLPQEAARDVVDRVIDEAPDLTTGQLRARLQRLCLEVDPDDARDRYERAVEDRRVVAEPTNAGTANLLGLDLPPDRVAAATRRINALARSLRGTGEKRTMDQLRADVLLDALLGEQERGSSGGARSVIDIHVDLGTLAGLTDHPGELAGFGPVIADIARHVVDGQPDAEWRVTITDPTTADPIACGTTRRRPTSAQKRQVHTRYRTCVFPGCRMPAVDCDLDHRIPWAEGGPTTVHHLAPGCRHDHVVRHRCGWRYLRRSDGVHVWTSPLGRTYTVKPDRPP